MDEEKENDEGALKGLCVPFPFSFSVFNLINLQKKWLIFLGFFSFRVCFYLRFFFLLCDCYEELELIFWVSDCFASSVFFLVSISFFFFFLTKEINMCAFSIFF